MSMYFKHYIAEVIFFLGLVSVILSAILIPTLMQANSNTILVIVTGVYVYLTYKLLQRTELNPITPHIRTTFVIVNTFESPLLTGAGVTVRNDDKIKAAKENSDPTKELVFLKVENVGKGTALYPKIELEYEKKDFDNSEKVNKEISLDPIKEEESVCVLLEVYQNASKSAYFKPLKREVEYHDTGTHKKKSLPHIDKTKVQEAEVRGEGTLVNFISN